MRLRLSSWSPVGGRSLHMCLANLLNKTCFCQVAAAFAERKPSTYTRYRLPKSLRVLCTNFASWRIWREPFCGPNNGLNTVMVKAKRGKKGAKDGSVSQTPHSWNPNLSQPLCLGNFHPLSAWLRRPNCTLSADAFIPPSRYDTCGIWPRRSDTLSIENKSFLVCSSSVNNCSV